MPTIYVEREDLFRLVGKELKREDLEEALFMLKTEVEEWGEELELSVDDSERPDLWSAEGLARALRLYMGIQRGTPTYNVQESEYRLINERPSPRPFIVAAVVKNVDLGEEGLRQLVQLQEKVMLSYGRKRKRIAIGTSRADLIEFPVTYREVEPSSLAFVPLHEEREMTLQEVLEKTEKGREYGHLLEGFSRYPVLLDAKGRVITFPPIINSNDLGRITADTRDIFVDVTGNHLPSMLVALNVVVTALAERGGNIYRVYVNGEPYPDLEPREIRVDPGYLRRLGGYDGELRDPLERMGYTVISEYPLRLLYPAYRGDIRHQRDVLEDLLSAYNYNRLRPEIPSIYTRGRLNRDSLLEEALKELLVGAGGEEVLTFTLSDPDFLRSMGMKPRLTLTNPVTRSFSVFRPSILPHLLRVLSKNSVYPYPQRIFEVGEVFDDGWEKRVAYMEAGQEASYTSVRQVLEFLGRKMGMTLSFKEGIHPIFIEGRTAEVLCGEEKVGYIGEVKPEILAELNLYVPVAGFEIKLSAFL